MPNWIVFFIALLVILAVFWIAHLIDRREAQQRHRAKVRA